MSNALTQLIKECSADYAEMYGFPLTIYLSVRLFGLDRNNLKRM